MICRPMETFLHGRTLAFVFAAALGAAPCSGSVLQLSSDTTWTDLSALDGYDGVEIANGRTLTLNPASGTTMNFKHLTAAFRLTLHATTATSLTKLKVYVYGSAAQPKVTVDDIDGVEYLVKWNNEGAAPNLPIGPVGEVTDQDIKYGSEMVFNLTGMTFNDGDDMTFCIPVTVANVKRISVVGYNGTELVFAKTSDLSANPVGVVRNTVYPVKTIDIN